jgi:hypothetical protein
MPIRKLCKKQNIRRDDIGVKEAEIIIKAIKLVLYFGNGFEGVEETASNNVFTFVTDRVFL